MKTTEKNYCEMSDKEFEIEIQDLKEKSIAKCKRELKICRILNCVAMALAIISLILDIFFI